jgi:hypothetical protein
MKVLKKAFKIACLVLLISLACFGISISGGVPAPFSRKRDNTVEIKIELLEQREEKTDASTVDFIQ